MTLVPVNKGEITFLDTPGHAAFSSIRARGAKVTDLIVLVVAAGDGVMAQTREVIQLAEKHQVPLVVAISKCDAFDEAAVRAVRADLRKHQVWAEEDGGEVQMVPVSGLTGQGVGSLLTAIEAQAELMELTADPVAQVEASIIEVKQVKGQGFASTVVIRQGTLKPGCILVGDESWLRVRSMIDDSGKSISVAGPSKPVEITGWKVDVRPEIGMTLREVESEAIADDIVREHIRLRTGLEALDAVKEAREREKLDDKLWELIKKEGKDPTASPRFVRSYDEVTKAQTKVTLSVILKCDTIGSLEAIQKSLLELPKKKAIVNLIASGVGPVSPSDVEMAKTASAYLIAFNLPAIPRSLSKGLPADRLLSFKIIYKLIDDVQDLMVRLIPPVWKETKLGQANVLQLFPLSDSANFVVGCTVTEGTIYRGSGPAMTASVPGLPPSEYVIRVLRRGEAIHPPHTSPRIRSLRHVKKEMASAGKGLECGIVFEPALNDIQPGDQIVALQRTPSFDTLS